MPPKERRNSNALALLRRVGTEPIMSMVRVGADTTMASAMTRAILRNIHLAFITRKQENLELNSTENSYAPEQRDGAEPVLKWVRVAVKPDPSGSSGNYWDESAAFEPSSKKWQGGLTSQGEKSKRSKKPAFVLREVAYDDWRKHYAKDKFGIYRGTEAPAENCILTPEDEIKWRSKPTKTEANQPESSEAASPPMQQIKRSATLPVHQEVDSEMSLQAEEASTVPKQQGEAIFVDEEGHTASRIVEEPDIRSALPASQTAPTSPASPIFPGPSSSLIPPNSPSS